MSKLDIKILIATHKKYWMPSDDVYIPIHVGRKNKLDLGYLGDDTKDNISAKNPNYCELTALYWAWKNLPCEYLGLCHYRRYFSHKSLPSDNTENKKRIILKRIDYEKLLKSYDIILPKKRNYYIETVRSQYEHAHHKRDLNTAEKIIAKLHPEYSRAFTKVMSQNRLYIFNMFVMKKTLFDEYCKWLFSILFEVEKQIDIQTYTTYEARVFGFLGERLFNVWLEKQRLKIKEVNVVCLEKINWKNKIFKFLKRKLIGVYL